MPKLISTCLFLILSQFLHAQFDEKQTVLESNNTTFLDIGDIDNDGKNDIIASLTASNERQLVWYENYENTDFLGFKVLIDELNSDVKAAIKDVNQDGINDLIVFEYWDVIFLEGIGNGDFASPVFLENPIFSTIDNIQFLDFEGDGDEDIIFKSGQSMVLFSYVGGNLIYESSILFEDVSFSVVYLFADMNGDGLVDVIRKGSYEVSLSLGEGGSFGEAEVVISITDDSNYRQIYLADMNGDDNLDIITTRNNPNQIGWNPNLDNTGDFGNYQIWDSEILVQSLNIKDVDSDGDLDIISNNTSENKLKWYENNGVGAVAPAQVFYSGDNASSLSSVTPALGDIDGDDDLDVVAIIRDSKETITFTNEDGAGNFSEKRTIDYFLQPFSIQTLDMDNDEDSDFLVAASRGIFWVENTSGEGSFGEVHTLEFASGSDSPREAYALDIDEDGDMDVIGVWGSGLQGHKLYLNLDGAGSFSTGTIIAPYSTENSFFEDIDADGDTDILLVRHQPYTLMWIENVNGSFATEHLIAQDFTFSDKFIFADIDSDGDKDLISQNDEIVSWRENTDASFASPVTLLNGFTIIDRFAVTDMDADGDADLIFVCNKLDGTNGREARLYRNNSTGNSLVYDAPQIIDLQGFATGFFVEELNGDAYPDLLIAHNEETFLHAGGASEFLEPELLEELNLGFTTITVGSVNSNGGKDLAFSSNFDFCWVDNYYESARIEGVVFWDENENGVKDVSEIILNNQEVTLEPASDVVWTDENGEFTYIVSPGT